MNSTVIRDRDYAKTMFEFKYPGYVIDDGNFCYSKFILLFKFIFSEALRKTGNLELNRDYFLGPDAKTFVKYRGKISFSEVYCGF